MKILLIIFFIVTSIQSVFSQDTSLVDELASKWSYSAGYFEYVLDLKKDGRYKQSMKGDLIERFSEGYWILKSDSQIILNSDFQINPNSMIKEERLDKSKFITFIVDDLTGDPVDFLIIKFITKTEVRDTFIISKNGRFVVPKVSFLDSIEIKNPIFQSLKWNYNSEFNQYQIVLAQNGYSKYIIKQNEVWLYKNGRLYSPNSIKDKQFFNWVKNRKDYYEKIKN